MNDVLVQDPVPPRGADGGARIRVVTEALDLSGCRLGPVDWTDVVFEAPVRARGTIFTSAAVACGARFRAAADFGAARFDNDARFDGAVFEDTATFAGAEFRGIAAFDAATFERAADLSGMTCLASLSLQATQFRISVSLKRTECLGGFWGERTGFPRDTLLSGLEVHGRSWIVGATMEGRGGPLPGWAAAVRCFGDSWPALP